QGITTEIIGEGSTPALWTRDTADRVALDRYHLQYDWTGFDGYLHTLQNRGTSINLGSFAPVAAIREQVLGMQNRTPTPEELQREQEILDRAMQQGAFGFATALIYPPASYTHTEELVALARVASKYGGVYISHVRGESFRVKDAIGEAIDIGRQAGLPVVIYHLKIGAKANWGHMDEIRAEIEEARARGVNVSACQYPYTAGGTNLPATLPGWAQEGGREKMLERLKNPAERAKMRRDVGPLGSGQPHPRSYGTFPRILGRYVRDEHVLALPEAIRKMTSLAASQMKIADRGTVREGFFADLVVLDPKTVADTATFEK